MMAEEQKAISKPIETPKKKKKEGIIMKKALWVSLCMAIGIFTANTAVAADSIKLRVADAFPPGHYVSEKITRPWIADILKRTGHKLSIEYYPAEQLGKARDLLSLTASGVVDIAYVVPSYATDKLPLSGVVGMPINLGTSCNATKVFQKLATDDNFLAKHEYGPNKVRVLWSLVYPPYQIMISSRVKFDGLKSLQGLKIRTTGGIQERILRALGAMPVQISSPELYEAVSRGTVDGALFPYGSVYSYGFDGLFKYGTVNENFGSVVITYSMNEDKWNSLPTDIQKAILDASQETVTNGCRVADEEGTNTINKLKESGWEIREFSAADKKELSNKTRGIVNEWAEALDKRNKPGTDVLKVFENALK